MPGRRIAILMHETDDKRRARNYAIWDMRKLWKEDGHRVKLLYGVGTWWPADLLLVHVDLSVVPPDYLDFARRYPVALNARLGDIRKRSFADNLLGRGDTWDGPVIVKSDLNYGGVPERRLQRRGMPVAGHPEHLYRVFERLDEVPGEWFEHPLLVVQKFQPERDGEDYCARNLHCMGDYLSCVLRKSRSPVVCGANCLPGYDEVEPHPEIIATRRIFAVDYGKLDYVEVDGRAILLDINKTIGNSRFAATEAWAEQRRKRARGLYAYFDGMQPFSTGTPAPDEEPQPVAGCQPFVPVAFSSVLHNDL